MRRLRGVQTLLGAFTGLSLAFLTPLPTAWAEPSHLIPPERVANAIWAAEGGNRTRHPYGVLSVKVNGEAQARRVCLNSIRNSRARWEKAGRPGDWLEFFAKRWCPVGAENDPTGLNKNWLKNVRRILASDV